MRIDLRTRETLVLLFGMLGLVEQETTRLISAWLGTSVLEPSPVLSGIFGTMVLGSIGVGVVRGSGQRRPSGDDTP